MASGTCQPPSSATDARPPANADGVRRSLILQSGPWPQLRILCDISLTEETTGVMTVTFN